MNIKQASVSLKITMWLLSGIIVMIMLFLLACAKPIPPLQTTTSASTTLRTTTTGQTIIPLPTTLSWLADGIINPNEYMNTVTYDNGSYELYWKNDEKYIYIGIKVKTSGWVSIGFNAVARMKDVDMVFGWVTNSKAAISDQFSTGDFGPHSEDSVLGGTTDVTEFGGQENGSYTTLEFKRALVTGVPYDAKLITGPIPIIWSYSSADNINVQHINRGYGQMQIQ